MELLSSTPISHSTKGEDDWLIVAPGLRWQPIVLSGPLAVCVMGQVLLMSCTDNFTLDQPQGGLQHVRWPDFRPATLQVVHETYRAFILADDNMGAIRDLSKRFPTEVNTLLNYLRSEGPHFVKAMVPVQLSHLRDLSRDCYVKSVEIKKRFEAALLVVNELLQSCVSTKGTYEQKIEQTKNKLAQSIAEMSTLKIKDIDFNEIEQILQRAVDALSELSVHWDNLALFFYSVNQQVEGTTTNQLIDTINASSDGTVRGASVMRRAIDNLAARIMQQQVVLYDVAKLYKEVSSEYLLDALALLYSMISIDSKQTELMESKMVELGRLCQAAQDAISAKIATKGAEYAEQIKERTVQLEKTINDSPVVVEQVQPLQSARVISFTEEPLA